MLEGNDIRVGSRTPCGRFAVEELQENALPWAAEAKKLGQVRTSSKGGPLVMSSHLARMG